MVQTESNYYPKFLDSVSVLARIMPFYLSCLFLVTAGLNAVTQTGMVQHAPEIDAIPIVGDLASSPKGIPVDLAAAGLTLGLGLLLGRRPKTRR